MSAARIAVPAWPRRVRETLLAYLPVLLMALLALATWWLVKNTPVPGPERAAAPPRQDPDYTMQDFLVQRFGADGALRVQIEGTRLQHFPATDTLEIDAPRIVAHGPDGRLTEATARRAIASGDGSELQLIGDARVVRNAAPGADAIEFRGEYLHAFANTERLRSHLPVVVTRGATVIHADGVEFDHLAQRIDFLGRMRASFAPRGATR